MLLPCYIRLLEMAADLGTRQVEFKPLMAPALRQRSECALMWAAVAAPAAATTALEAVVPQDYGAMSIAPTLSRQATLRG